MSLMHYILCCVRNGLKCCATLTVLLNRMKSTLSWIKRADWICLIIDSAPVYYCESVLCKTLSHVLFVHSLLLDVLCRVHAELAAIDEEDEKLDSAVKHLQKALELDPDSEHLSSCLHLLQLRSSVHSAPTRPEERAAQLIQQVLHTHSMISSPHT